MQEKLLQFIWQYSLYRPDGLFTTDGQPVQVIHPGTLNTDAGPDFSAARVRIGNTILIGQVELHVRTSEWILHGHQHDPAYRRLILHVVYAHDTDELPGGIPVLALKDHIPLQVLERYTGLLQTTHPLPCAAHLGGIHTLTKESWLSRMLVERWEEKLGLWQEELKEAGGDWRVLLYWRMAANFGFKVNAAPFGLLARSLPLSLVGKQHHRFQIEALLFGQAGMLSGHFTDEYGRSLQEEYDYLRRKYNLQPIAGHLWKFMRLRPANFPTVRIAQFAHLVHRSLHLFSKIGERSSLRDLAALLEVDAGPYWEAHYRFDEAPQAKGAPKRLGPDSVYNIIINTIAPVRFLYAFTQGMKVEQEAALRLLEELPAEDNKVIRLWTSHHWLPVNAGQSQSLLQLYHQYCSRKRCLECAVGLQLIRSRPDKEH